MLCDEPLNSGLPAGGCCVDRLRTASVIRTFEARSRAGVECVKVAYRWLQLPIIVSVLLLLRLMARPCQCTHIGSVAEEYPQAVAVFDGRVEKKTAPGSRRAGATRGANPDPAIYDTGSGWQPPEWMGQEMRELLENGRVPALLRFCLDSVLEGGQRQHRQGSHRLRARGLRKDRFCCRSRVPGVGAHEHLARVALQVGRADTDMCTRTMEAFSSRLEELPPEKVRYPSE